MKFELSKCVLYYKSINSLINNILLKEERNP